MAPFFTYHFYTGDPDDSIALAIAASVGVFLLATLLEFGIAIAGKWLIAGRLKAGRYPLWGITYYRWWLADRLVESAPTYLLSGSSLYAWWLRALGAKIGPRRDHRLDHAARSRTCCTIGAGVSIGNAVNFENARVEHGELRLGIDRGGARSLHRLVCGAGRQHQIGAFGHLEGQSALSDGQARAGQAHLERLAGARCRRIRSRSDPGPSGSVARPAVGEAAFFVFGALLITTLFFMPVFPSFMLIDWLDNIERFPWLQNNEMSFQLVKYFLLAFPATAVLIVCTALLSAGIRWSCCRG